MSDTVCFNCDTVFCIDATDSMGSFISEFRRFVPSLNSIVVKCFEENDKDFGKLRVRFIFFRDFGYDKEPMVESQFFVLPEETEEMMSFLKWQEGCGGGDRPESALEAISLAIDSEWSRAWGTRQAVVLFTDSDAHPLGEHSRIPGYPENMPKDFDELTERWENNGENGFKRIRSSLLLFCPADISFAQQTYEWHGSFHLQLNPTEITCEDLVKNLTDYYNFIS